MANPQALLTAGLTQDEVDLIAASIVRIDSKRPRNVLLSRYYHGKHRAKSLGIAIPPQLSRIEMVAGWPSTVVDSLEERLDIDSFAAVGVDTDLGIDEWWQDNDGPTTAGMAIVDSEIYGCTFVALSPGGAGEPNPLLTVEPATTMTGVWSARARKLTSATHVGYDDQGQLTRVTLWTDRDVIECVADGNTWTVDRRPHGLDHVPVFRLANRPRADRPWGSSEISRAVRSYTDSAVRTMLGMEIGREFYSSPQRWIMGADERAFVDADGNPKPAWEAYLGRFLALQADPENDHLPQVGQFTASSPAPYVEQVKLLAELCAAEGALPVTYFGFHTDNPPGGDGIRAQETRLVKRAERRQRDLGGMSGFAGLIRSMLLMRDGTAPDRIVTRWKDPATPTKAATADQVTKLVSVGVLYPDSDVTRTMLGFDPVTREQLAEEDRRRRAQAMTVALRRPADAVDNPDS